jgi:hypothetical protein
MPWSPGHGDRAANAIVSSIKHGENGRLAAELNRATEVIRAEGDVNHLFHRTARRLRLSRWKSRGDVLTVARFGCSLKRVPLAQIIHERSREAAETEACRGFSQGARRDE